MAGVISVLKLGNKIGFLGAGRMTQALSQGLQEQKENIIVSDVDDKVLKILSEQGLKTTQDNKEVLQQSDIIIIAVKPHIVPTVLQDVAPLVTPNQLFVSLAAGVTTQSIEQLLPDKSRVIRTMPNTPSLVLHGATVYSPGTYTTEDDNRVVETLFSSVGTCDMVPERNIDAVTGVSGSGPAYVFMAIEAMADGGVKMGLPRDLAMKLAAQTLLGAAKMVMETSEHPGALKDGVCSPGGTTIVATSALEREGFRHALISAVEAATKRSQELSKS